MQFNNCLIAVIASACITVPLHAETYENNTGQKMEKIRDPLPDMTPSILNSIASNKSNYDTFCASGSIDSDLFLGEIISRYNINPIEISTPPIAAASANHHPFLSWLVSAHRCDYASQDDFNNPRKCGGRTVNRRASDRKPLRDDAAFALVQSRGHLSDFVTGAQKPSTKSFYVEFAKDAASQELKKRVNNPAPDGSEPIPVAITRALFSRTGGGAKISVKCPEHKEKKPKKQSKIFAGLRSKPGELLIPRVNAQGKVLDKFKALKPATVSYENNAEKGARTAAIEFTAGIGTLIRNQEYAIGFVSYKFQKTDSDDDDDDKTIHTVTPGVLYSREFTSDSFGPFSFFGGYYGGSIRSTIDIAQNSEALKLNLFTRGFVFDFANRRGAPICGGRNRVFGSKFLSYNCDGSLFTEIGHVFDAGSNVALTLDNDDQYVGLGGGAELELTLDGVPIAKSIGVRTAYRHMQVISGALANQSRFESAVKYELENGLSLELSYEEGQDIESFQDEEKLKLSLGYKY